MQRHICQSLCSSRAPVIQLNDVTTKEELNKMDTLVDYLDQCGCDVPIKVCLWFSLCVMMHNNSFQIKRAREGQ